jgi:CheY-like chemotaxis protein
MEQMMLKGKKILVVDDETDLRDIVASELEFMGAEVYQAENVSRAKLILDTKQVDLIVSDIRMPGGTGIDLLNYVKTLNTLAPPIVLITGFADISLENAFNQGAEALLSKPFKLEDLVSLSTKLTSNMEERYKSDKIFTAPTEILLEYDDFIANKIMKDEFAIGRGGMSLMVENRSSKWDIGDVVDFRILFKDVTLEGTAVCRWWKPDETENRAIFGFEFLHLSDDSFNYFNSYWKDHTIIPFIPSLNERHI